MSSNSGRDVAFVDTNVMHYMALYLRFAKSQQLYPWIDEDDERSISEAAKAIRRTTEKNLADSYAKGLAVLRTIVTKELSVLFAAVSELELVNGRARGRAVLSAAKEGVPDRMWSRIAWSEIMGRVSSNELTEIVSEVAELTNMLGDTRVGVTVGDPRRNRDEVELAKVINGLVYVPGMDALIFASALLAQADYLYTGDGDLGRTVNLIRSPGRNVRFGNVSEQLRKTVAGILMADASSVVFPISPKLSGLVKNTVFHQFNSDSGNSGGCDQ